MAKFQPPPIRTNFIGNPPQAEIANAKNVPAYAWTNFFQNITNALSSQNVPANSNAKTLAGVPIQIAVDANFLYIAVGTNQWKRVALNAF